MVPFHLRTSVMVMFDITEGGRPPRPLHRALTDELWGLMERCWHQEPHSRPEMSEVLRMLRSSSVFLSSLQPVMYDWSA